MLIASSPKAVILKAVLNYTLFLSSAIAKLKGILLEQPED